MTQARNVVAYYSKYKDLYKENRRFWNPTSRMRNDYNRNGLPYIKYGLVLYCVVRRIRTWRRITRDKAPPKDEVNSLETKPLRFRIFFLQPWMSRSPKYQTGSKLNKLRLSHRAVMNVQTHWLSSLRNLGWIRLQHSRIRILFRLDFYIDPLKRRYSVNSINIGKWANFRTRNFLC